MTDSSQVMETTVVMTADAIEKALTRMALEIASTNPDHDSIVLLGILKRGRPLADLLAQELNSQTGHMPRVGSLATTLYRDDLRSQSGTSKLGIEKTHFDFDVSGAAVILVDDVIASGRTVRAALDEVMDYGRPACIRLACLVDRGLRELPIQADYLGFSLSTSASDHVSVRLEATDGENAVILERVRTQE